MRAMSCLVTGCREPSQAAHVIARGWGGVKGDYSHLVPLCDFHHRMAGEYGTSARASFELRHSLDLLAFAAVLCIKLDVELGLEACYICKGVGAHEPLCRAAPRMGAIL